MNASDAREELEAAIRRSATFPDSSGRRRCVLSEEAIEALLRAADAYRGASPDKDGRTVHLEGIGGARTACRYRWQEYSPKVIVVTGNPAAVSCGACLRSRRYRDLTAEAA